MMILSSGMFQLALLSASLINAILLMAISTPLVYIFVIRPFVDLRDEALAHVSYLAFTDPLTQLANRRLLMEHLEKLIAGSIRHKFHAALLLIDLDGFKAVNDIHGHDAGDALLVEIANRIKIITRSEDVISRLGGDEFVVLINHLGNEKASARNKAERVAAKISEAICRPFDYNGRTVKVGASIGVRLIEAEETDTESAIRDADYAMYRAKRTKKGSAVFFGE